MAEPANILELLKQQGLGSPDMGGVPPQGAQQGPTLQDCVAQCKPIFDAASADEKIMFLGAMLELPQPSQEMQLPAQEAIPPMPV